MSHRSGRFRPLLVRVARDAALGVAVASALLWLGSALLGSIGIFSLGRATSLRFERGVAEVQHVYAWDVAPSVPQAQWHDYAVKKGWTVSRRSPLPLLPPIVWGFLPGTFHYSSGHVVGIADGATVSPARYSVLQVPLWALMLPGAVVGVRMFVLRQRRRREQGRGFMVVGEAPPPAAAAAEPAAPTPVAPMPVAPVHS